VKTGNIHLTERLKWTRATLLRGLLMFDHLRITFLLTVGILLIAGLVFGLVSGLWFGILYSLSYGLSIGLSYWLWFGLFQGIAPERIEDQDRRIPNQGIQRSLYNSVIMSIISGAIIGTVTMLSNWLLYWCGRWLAGSSSVPDIGLNYWLLCGLLAGIGGGILACIVMGGRATLQHYVIRLLLWRSRTFPLLIPQFLEDATARFLLRRVGGGYQFAHRLLLDHLADAPMPGTEQLAESPTADSEPSL
jgi:MFS family permease